MAATSVLQVLLKGKDELSAVLKKNEGSLKSFAKSLGKASLAGGALAAGLGVAAVNAAADFEKQMANVSTLIDTNTESMDEMKQSVLDLSGQVGVPLDDLATSLYDVRSAGIASSDAMDVLEQSARLGVAGLGSQGEAVNLLTSAMNAYGFAGDEANQASDILFKTVQAGKTNISELAQSFGAVAGTAKANGVSFAELQAATAALTTTGQKASVAQTQLRAAILAISAPTSDMSAAIKELGYESGTAALEQDGLVEVMKKLNISADGDTEALKKMFGSTEALGAAISLTGEQNEAFTTTLNSMKEGSNEVDAAFEKQNETFDQQWQQLKNSLNVVMIELGNQILPHVTEAVKTLSQWVIDNKDNINLWVERLFAAIGFIKDVALDVFDKLTFVFNVITSLLSSGAGLWVSFKDSAVGAVQSLKTIVQPILDGISGAIDRVRGAIDAVKGYGAGVAARASEGFVSPGSQFQALAKGGIVSGGFRAFASGGVVDRPTIGLIGEGKHNEAVVPLPDGKSIPVQMKGGGSNSLTIQNVNIGNKIDQQEFFNMLARFFDQDNQGVPISF